MKIGNYPEKMPTISIYRLQSLFYGNSLPKWATFDGKSKKLRCMKSHRGKKLIFPSFTYQNVSYPIKPSGKLLNTTSNTHFHYLQTDIFRYFQLFSTNENQKR